MAAVAGDSADADRLLGLLAAHALMIEFDSGSGCDIQHSEIAANHGNLGKTLFEMGSGIHIRSILLYSSGGHARVT